jgi:GT2 family glycosyltransferase
MGLLMLLTIWARNKARNFLTILRLKVFRDQPYSTRQARSICFIAATRQSEGDFWKKSPLATWLAPMLSDEMISAKIAFENREGLSTVYNRAIREQTQADILIFLHDDLWLEDNSIIEKTRGALARFDIVGVAGNTRRSKNQPAWLFKAIEKGNFVWDHGYLSGSVLHGQPNNSQPSYFGPTPASCKLLDGVFLAANRTALIHSQVSFDERFKFHFYDMDFCRSASRAGLSLGTWPINLLHLSAGAFGSPDWRNSFSIYKQKWKR